MRLLLSFLLAVSVPVDAQDAKKKAAVKKKPAAHAKPTPEQIRKFNQLEQQKK